MGAPKPWLDWEGRPLLQRLVEVLGPAFGEVVVACAPGQDLPPTGARLVADGHTGRGPLSGLAAALPGIACSAAFVIPCDAPGISIDLAALLLHARGDALAAAPEWEGAVQPLPAVYARECGAIAADLLDQRRPRLQGLLDRAGCVVVREAEIRKVDPDGRSFLNLNTPEEYERLLRGGRRE